MMHLFNYEISLSMSEMGKLTQDYLGGLKSNWQSLLLKLQNILSVFQTFSKHLTFKWSLGHQNHYGG